MAWKPKVIRFHLDENVNHAIARGLRLRGLDVSTSADAQLLGQSDQNQFDYAIGEGRALFTHDADFLDPRFLRRPHPGIVYSPKDRRTIGEVVRFLALLGEVVEPADMQKHDEYF